MIERFEYPKYPLYKEIDGVEQLIDTFNNPVEVNRFRLKNLKEGLSGYYFKYNDEKIYITEYGDLSSFPQGFMDFELQLLMEAGMLALEKRREKREELKQITNERT